MIVKTTKVRQFALLLLFFFPSLTVHISTAILRKLVSGILSVMPPDLAKTAFEEYMLNREGHPITLKFIATNAPSTNGDTPYDGVVASLAGNTYHGFQSKIKL